MNYDWLCGRGGGVVFMHTCANPKSPSDRSSPALAVCVCPGLHSYVRCTLRANVEVTVVTVSQRTVWRRGPLIIRDRETDS